MTSNLGAKLIQEHGDIIDESAKVDIWKLVESTFPPEFINRLDQVIMFEPLKESELQNIVGIQLTIIKDRLNKHHLSLDITPDAQKYLAKTGYDPVYGARPLKRLIQNDVLDPLALMMLDKDLSHKTVIVDTDGKRLKLTVKK
jgi:ATP-dependent Clp protease ATP-binding subunit ClpB